MNRYDLSILIPARNEEWLAQTVKNILQNKRGKTEIIVGLDGAWANPGVPNHPDVSVVYYPEALGQRAMTNQLCKLSSAKYVMKIDAHCAVDEGFDIEMLKAFEEVGDDVTMIPALYNLHVFNWRCKKCGNEWYQGPAPMHCQRTGTDGNRPEHINPDCDNTTDFEKVVIFKPRLNKRSEFYRFDTTMHFQYHGKRKSHPDAQNDLVETMSAQGSCFMLTRENYWFLDISEEEYGSWGQQGTEVACKTWLSGRRLLTNKRTWYSHLFRTQEGFSFPYKQNNSQIEHAREYSRKQFLDNEWSKMVYPLLWLVDKFGPLDNKGRNQAADWHTEEGKPVYDYIKQKADEFWQNQKVNVIAKPEDLTSPFTPDGNKLTKGIIFYTDNQLNLKLAHKVQQNLLKISKEKAIPIVSSSLKPMSFGKNIVVQGERGYLTMAKQILAALKASDADIIFFCEHDVLYHPSHFDFTPNKNDIYYYNTNVWRVRQSDGHALYCDNLQQLSGLCAYRQTLISHFEIKVARLESNQSSEYVRAMGFEPGTHNRPEKVDGLQAESWQSEYPNLDIRHDNNLTPSRWSKDQFRNEKFTKGWTESTLEKIPDWNLTAPL